MVACYLSPRSPLSEASVRDATARSPACPPTRRPLQLAIIWINARGSEKRAKHVTETIDRALQRPDDSTTSTMAVRTERLEAVVPTCFAAGEPCVLNAPASKLNGSQIFDKEPSKLRRHTPQRKRAFAIGNFMSHFNAYARCLEMVPTPELCLITEDDAGLANGFLQALPCLLSDVDAAMPSSGYWHALRLGCWGSRFAADCVRPPGLFRAQSHAFNRSAEALAPGDGMAYGGAHLTLVRPATLPALISILLRQGVMAIDVALTNPPRHQQVKSQRRVDAGELRSYVLDAPGAFSAHGTLT